DPRRGAPAGGGLGGLAGGLGGVKGMALMALLAYLMQGRGGTAGLASLTEQLRGAGLGDRVDSWVGPGANRDIDPRELARAIPPEAMDDIERHTGLGRDEVLSELSRGLPGMVDRLTPRGRMPERDDELNDIDENEVLGQFGIVPGAAYGKAGPGSGGSKY
ncbi:YidB family protein, partial [Falsiroseomonas oryzae]|uniref:YidB family protein n=1 Tax=Falsiroseomonas oryzae TaxID=2766473 RepID=UPI0022EA7C1B